MPTIYQIGSDGYWTGATREIGDRDGVQRGWTRYAVPALEDGQYAAWGGSDWSVVESLPVVLAPTAEMVKIERDRRLALDFAFNGKMYQRDAESVARISGAGTLALAAIINGAEVGDLYWHGRETPFAWIASDDTLTTMDAQTCFAFGQRAAAVETEIIFAAKALREADPIPANFDNNIHWPS